MFIDWGTGRRERENKKHRWVVSHMQPDWGSNPQPFGAQDDTPTNWASWQGRSSDVFDTFHVDWGQERVWNQHTLL